MSTGTFYPQFRYISSITQGQRTVVFFDDTHDFTDGEIVSFRVSAVSGMQEINNVHARVQEHDNESITVDIDSNNFTPYVDRGQYIEHPAVCVPSSSGIIPRQAVATINLQDAFDNIPPNG